MDEPRFDALAKALGAAGPRRRLLAGLLGAGLAAPLGRAGAQDCKRNGKPCKKNGQCCSGNCAGGTGGSTAHSGGVCTCPTSCPTNFVQQADCGCVCPSGHQELNGGCFRVSPLSCSCSAACTTCNTGFAGSSDPLCWVGPSAGHCEAAGACPPGTACNLTYQLCLSPC